MTKKLVLFVGSDTGQDQESKLKIGVEAEARTLRAVYAKRAQFRWDMIPHASIDTIHDRLNDENEAAPSILHICSHGENGFLRFWERDRGAGAPLNHQLLDGLIPDRIRNTLELVYLDACNSESVAAHITGVPLIVAFKREIGVDASTRGSGIFHSMIASGGTVRESFDFLCSFLAAIDPNQPGPVLIENPPGAAERSIRPPPPTIIARFLKDDPTRDSSDHYAVNFGLRLSQVDHTLNPLACFYSDHQSYVEREYVTLIKRRQLRKGGTHEIWHSNPSLECWECDSDFSIYCSYFDDSREPEVVSCRVSDALKNGYDDGRHPPSNLDAINLAIEEISNRY